MHIRGVVWVRLYFLIWWCSMISMSCFVVLSVH
jgi:hypothetical protein